MIDQRAVYIYKWPGDKDFIGIALDAHMHEGELRFHSTTRGRSIKGKVKKETANGFIFTSEGTEPGDWEFMILTIQEFKRKYHRLAVNGETIAAKIRTTEDLHYWYRREFNI